MGKSTISMVIFNSFLYVYQAGYTLRLQVAFQEDRLILSEWDHYRTFPPKHHAYPICEPWCWNMNPNIYPINHPVL